MSVYETLIYEIQDNVAILTMNRPERRNALNAQLNADLLSAFQQAQADETVRAVVLTGAGKGFCAGADLTAVATIPLPTISINASSTATSRLWD
ncbi:MAG: enoyl-CoA hydratase-related protein [Chloroflexi bacterium]|nr:enoyl-CoA hydratase-related protein [Chloroflexota bacterium]